MKQGLEGLQVLELGGGIAAGVAGKLLADLGATVVKVESPEGDATRSRGPFRDGRSDPEASGTYIALNTNKRSVVLDLKTHAGQEPLYRLSARAPLLIHDYRPIEMARHGIDYDRLSALNPSLVMLSLTPFGLSGPYRDYAASDLTLTHGGGWGWICPGKSQRPDLPPIKPYGQHALAQAGLHGMVAALAAVYAAERTGRGEHIDLSIQEVVIGLLYRHFASFTYSGKIDNRMNLGFYEPLSFYPCRDGYLFLIAPEDSQFDSLVELMGDPDWAKQEKFKGRFNRAKHQFELKDLISRWTAGWKVEELFHACQQGRVGAAPFFAYEQLENREHLIARKSFAMMDHPTAGRLKVIGAPYQLQHPWWALRRPAPALGEANRELEELFGERPQPASRPGAGGDDPQWKLPLAGIRVLDLTWVWAGPHCTQLLAMLGAEVLKVESSSRPDLGRRADVYASGMEPGLNRCSYFNSTNQGKRSIGINLRHPEGIALIKRLAALCDVTISNFGTGVVERMGLGADVIHDVNPDMIIATISAFGQTGPMRQYMGYGPLIPPLAGVVCGYEDGIPQDVGMAYADPNAGAYTAVAIVASLLSRQWNTGGQVIDVSLWEAMINTGFEGWIGYQLGRPPVRPMGNRDPVYAPHNCYRCAGEDDWVAIAVTEEGQWAALCRVLARPDLAEDPSFRNAVSRKANEDKLDALISAWCAGRNRWDVTALLQEAGVPAFPSMSSRDLLENPHLERRGYFNSPPHPEVGERAVPGIAWRFTNRSGSSPAAAPQLGADTDNVLREVLGLGAAEIARLHEEKVVESPGEYPVELPK
jgi:crotonobetainyl-CoA:carnitine CoA-transferase CaiB-like acyl-CoA transferase